MSGLAFGMAPNQGLVQAATLTLNATPLTVEAGTSSRLDWTATNVTTCTAGGGWQGPRPPAGAEQVAPESTTTYDVRCEGAMGTVARSVTVGVKGDDCEESGVCTLDSPTRSCLFRLVVTDDEIVRIAVRERDAMLTARWRLVTATATPASSCGSLRSGESDCGPLAPGEYTIQVSAASGTGAASVHRQRLTRCPSTRVDCGQGVHDTIEPVGDVDLFRFTAAAGERVRVTARELAGTLDVEWRLLTITGARAGSCDTFRRSLAEDCGPLPAGEYQLQVRDELGGRTGTYAVHLDRLTVGAACGVTPMRCDQTIRDEIDPIADSDLFQFTVAADEVVRIVVEERGGALVAEWRLLTEAGAPAPACDTFTTARAADCGPLPAGRYLVHVKDDVARRTGSYEISLFNLVHLCANCGNGILTPGEQCDPPGPCCTSTCRFVLPGAICRARTGPCDQPEVCSGTHGTCPEDRLLDDDIPCRPAVDVCDAPEVCSGTSADCPKDVFMPAATVCRAAAGDCDARETCSGVGPACGPDLKHTGICRRAAGSCDVAERCDGESDDCPADRLAPTGTVCRAAADRCDMEERCAGATASCPGDQMVPLACGDGCRDPREQCGEPDLPGCAAGQACVGCVCLPCASAAAACSVTSSPDSPVRVRLMADSGTSGAWTGTIRWDPLRLRFDGVEAAVGIAPPTCVVDAEGGVATCEAIAGTSARAVDAPPVELARASFTTIGAWPAAAEVAFALTALERVTGGAALVCPDAATCGVPECATAAECDDGNPCTRDVCADTHCVHPPPTGYSGADCEIAQVLNVLRCGERPLDPKLVRMLFRRVEKTRRLLGRAVAAPAASRRTQLVRRADRVLAAAQRRVLRAPSAHDCGPGLVALLEDRRGLLARLVTNDVP